MKWHGVEQHPDAHPERPWWRKEWAERAVYDPLLGMHGGTRTHREHTGWRRLDGLALTRIEVELARFAPLDTLAFHDREHPLLAPEPALGQRWVWPDPSKTSALVVGVDAGEVYFGCPVPTRSLGRRPTLLRVIWPPFDAVLADGEGGPWAPVEMLP